jgi:DNA-binding transcriptional MerR regulator
MNIGELAQAAGVTTDTVRYYEKQKLLPPALRQDNGYRRYTPAHLGQLRFVRSAQGLGFALREIRDILPALNEGRLRRRQIEERLHAKLAEIDQHMALLRQRRQELLATFALLKCSPDTPLAAAQATAPAQPAVQPRGRKPSGTQRLK